MPRWRQAVIRASIESLADFGLAVRVPTLEMGFPIVLAAGGLIFLLRDLRQRARS